MPEKITGEITPKNTPQYTHEVKTQSMRRHGERCEILTPTGRMTQMVQVRFEDGTMAVMDRNHLRMTAESRQAYQQKQLGGELYQAMTHWTKK